MYIYNYIYKSIYTYKEQVVIHLAIRMHIRVCHGEVKKQKDAVLEAQLPISCQ